MTASAGVRRLLAGAAVAALLLAPAVGGTTPAVALAARAVRSDSGGHGVTPAVGVDPPKVPAGRVTPGLRSDFPLTFSCQRPDAEITCYTPDQLRAAYGYDTLIGAGYTGRGRTIVIVDAYSDPPLRRDLQDFDAAFGLPAAKLKIVAPDGEVPFDVDDENQVGWSGEIALDVEWAHAMAPGAKIVLVEARTNDDDDIQSALQYVADHDLGDVVSQSFGEAESCYGVNADGTRQPGATLAAAHRIYAQMAAKKMSVFASAGDDGSAQPTCDGSGFKLAASTPASDPLVTGVGGTELQADQRTGAYQGEVVWNEVRTFGAAGGGGFSSVYDQPGFQRAAGDLPGRGVPDVAYNAAIDGGVLVAWSVTAPRGSFFIFGGTSAGSPQWAALGAIADQLNRGRLGDLNPLLYGLPATAFHDITKGNNAYPGVPGYTASTGWDPTTGLGSPYAGRVALGLAAAG